MWADENRVLPKTSPEPGPWRSDRTPFFIQYTHAAVDPKYDMCVAVAPSQVGKTEALLNIVGHRLDTDPVPVLWIGPTRNNVERGIEPRFLAMVKSVGRLWEKLRRGKSETRSHKRIAGTTFRLAWAGSATEMASDSVALVEVDEVDRMDDIPGEGDPITMAQARAANYPDGRVLTSSSPTLGSVTTYVDDHGLERWAIADSEDIQSHIWQLWQEGTRHEWAWPCPDCEEYFIPRFKLLWWPEDATPDEALTAAKLTCPKCGSLIDDSKKRWMNEHGHMLAPGQWMEEVTLWSRHDSVQGEAPDVTTWSQWKSGLCSPWRSWGKVARDWLRAVQSGEAGRIQGVLNLELGELYSIAGEALDWELVSDKKRQYSFDEIPAFTKYIFLTVDVQKDRLIYVIRGWGAGMESGLIRHGEILGDTEYDEVWNRLDDFRDRRFSGVRIKACLIDSGYKPGEEKRNPDNQIYAFCRRHPGWARATKGHDKQDKPLKATNIDVTLKGKTYKKGLRLWHLDTDHFKSWVHARLQWPHGAPGDWILPQDTDVDYCQQITAEVRKAKSSGAVTWYRIRKDNHYLDCEMMQVAAAEMFSVWRLKAPEREIDTEVELKDEKETAQEERKEKPRRKRKPVSL